MDANLRTDLSKQEELKHSIRGHSLISFFSFLQAHLTQDAWNKIKDIHNPIWATMSIDSDIFDLLRYSRDCYAHNWQGKLFPSTQNNTIRFRALEHTKFSSLNITILNDSIHITDDTVSKAKEFIMTIIDNLNDNDLIE